MPACRYLWRTGSVPPELPSEALKAPCPLFNRGACSLAREQPRIPDHRLGLRGGDLLEVRVLRVQQHAGLLASNNRWDHQHGSSPFPNPGIAKGSRDSQIRWIPPDRQATRFVPVDGHVARDRDLDRNVGLRHSLDACVGKDLEHGACIGSAGIQDQKTAALRAFVRKLGPGRNFDQVRPVQHRLPLRLVECAEQGTAKPGFACDHLPMSETLPLQTAIAALEAQRALLGDAVVDAALGPMREQLARLSGPAVEPAPEQALKQVAVLFLDVVGSTALSQHLDPEDIHAVMDGALARCTEVVVAHGGKVLQYAGDNLLAAFGAERRQEDDAERAVHCGLALLEQGRELGERVRKTYGHDGCNVRVGIHTGPVLLGGGVDEEGTIRGLSVNIAARMEQTAPVGALRISHDTWLQVRGVFDVEVQPPLLVKGRDEPLLTYLVQRAKPRAFRVSTRGIEGVATPLVGRDAELAQLAALLDEAVAQRVLRAATVIGQPGMGKSRLLHELQGLLESRAQRFWLLLGRAHPGSRLQPYGVLRDLLAWRLQIADSDSSEIAKAKLVDGLTPWLGEQAVAKAHRIGQLIGLDFAASPHVRGLEPRLLRALGFAALHDYLRGLAASGAVLAMLLEDLQWADDASLDFIAELLNAQALPLVLVATARPELLERRSAWAEGAAAHHTLRLAGPGRGTG